MLNEDVQAWVDLGFSEEEAVAMSNAMKDRYDDEITDDDSNSPYNDFWDLKRDFINFSTVPSSCL